MSIVNIHSTYIPNHDPNVRLLAYWRDGAVTDIPLPGWSVYEGLDGGEVFKPMYPKKWWDLTAVYRMAVWYREENLMLGDFRLTKEEWIKQRKDELNCHEETEAKNRAITQSLQATIGKSWQERMSAMAQAKERPLPE